VKTLVQAMLPKELNGNTMTTMANLRDQRKQKSDWRFKDFKDGEEFVKAFKNTH